MRWKNATYGKHVSREANTTTDFSDLTDSDEHKSTEFHENADCSTAFIILRRKGEGEDADPLTENNCN